MDRIRVPCSDDRCGGCIRFWPWEVCKCVLIYPHHCPAVLALDLPRSPVVDVENLVVYPLKSQSSALAAFPHCSLGLFLSLAQSKLWSNAGCPPESSSEIGQSDWCDRRSLGMLSLVLVGAFSIFFSLSLSAVCSVTPPCTGSARPWPLGSTRAGWQQAGP